MQVVSLTDTRVERGLLGREALIARTQGVVKFSQVRLLGNDAGSRVQNCEMKSKKFNVDDFEKNAKTHTLNLKMVCTFGNIISIKQIGR